MCTIGSGYGPDCIERAQVVAGRHQGLWFTAGLHPHDAKHWGDDVITRLRRAAADPRCVALGEMGLDFHYDLSPRDEQRVCFREQIALARELDKPIVIHDRDSDEETLAILVAEGAFEGRVLFHCYSGGVAYMERIVAEGGYISIPGIVTFKKADTMRAVASAVPEDRLLVETDSPFLTARPVPGQAQRARAGAPRGREGRRAPRDESRGAGRADHRQRLHLLRDRHAGAPGGLIAGATRRRKSCAGGAGRPPGVDRAAGAAGRRPALGAAPRRTMVGVGGPERPPRPPPERPPRCSASRTLISRPSTVTPSMAEMA